MTEHTAPRTETYAERYGVSADTVLSNLDALIESTIELGVAMNRAADDGGPAAEMYRERFAEDAAAISKMTGGTLDGQAIAEIARYRYRYRDV